MILLYVRWYLRYSLTYRDLEEIMAERNLSVDHVTIWRWVQRYAPILNQRIRREMRRPNRSWRVDETEVLRLRIGRRKSRSYLVAPFKCADASLPALWLMYWSAPGPVCVRNVGRQISVATPNHETIGHRVPFGPECGSFRT